MSNYNRTVLYIGVTANLHARVYQHKIAEGSNFTITYKCHDLIYFETFPTIDEAIVREKRLKKWKREWKENLIRSSNPEMKDLSGEVAEYQ